MYQNYFQQQFPQTMTYGKPNVEWINVNGVQGAKDVQVSRGQTAWLMDMNEPVFYVKEANNMGVCSLKAYRFEEINAEQNNTAYATKDDILRIEQELMKLRGAEDESINE